MVRKELDAVEICGKHPGSKTNQAASRGEKFSLTERFPDAGSSQHICACSACAGDYEDPDRTASAADEPDANELDLEQPGREGHFPAQGDARFGEE